MTGVVAVVLILTAVLGMAGVIVWDFAVDYVRERRTRSERREDADL